MTSFDDLLQRTKNAGLALVADAFACVRFYSRLPVPALPSDEPAHPMPDFSRAVRMLPIASLAIGFPAAVTLLVVTAFPVPPLLSASLALAVLLRTTGALHEDGLADTADGFGGGLDGESKLAIMRDSRVGSYGAIAVALALLTRASALAALIERGGGWGAAAAILAAAAASRTAALIPLELLEPARADGAGLAAHRPSPGAMQAAAVGVAVVTLLFCVPSYGIVGPAAACILCVAAGAYIAHLARRHVGGYTGDILGAAQQLAEIGFLTGLLIAGPLV